MSLAHMEMPTKKKRLLRFLGKTYRASFSIQLQITHCTGLARTDHVGLLNPFCVVIWPDSQRDSHLGRRTPTIYNTLHPVWKACYFELPLRTPEQDGKVHEGGSRPSDSESDTFDTLGNVNNRGTVTKGKSRKNGRVKREAREQGADIELTVQVWDEKEGADACFLGGLTFGAEALLEMGRGRQNLVSLHSTSFFSFF